MSVDEAWDIPENIVKIFNGYVGMYAELFEFSDITEFYQLMIFADLF